ncbi:hypothetical protein WG936_04055 [Corynebacterium sp. H127]|uniref:hypothetical protein n=1 Tax=Corynebacterium sp. H127 TaxID=3133418 RepID=UPI00309589B1
MTTATEITLKSRAIASLDSVPTQLHAAVEDNGALVLKLASEDRDNRSWERVALERALRPLADKGWLLQPGAWNVQEGESFEYVLTPPAKLIDLRKLPLVQQIQIETRGRIGTGVMDLLKLLDLAGDATSFSVDSRTLDNHMTNVASDVIQRLNAAGWTVYKTQFFGTSSWSAEAKPPAGSKFIPATYLG